MTKPITPDDIRKIWGDVRPATIPPQVIEAFNELITKNWDGHSATVRRSDVVRLIMEKLQFAPGELHSIPTAWLNVEGVFAKAGWVVGYGSGHDEIYEASYRFTRRRPHE